MATFPDYINIDMRAYKIEPQQVVLRSDFEDGPPKQSEFNSKQLDHIIIVGYIQTNANFQSWQTWYRTTIKHGADWFDWEDPVDGVTKLARIVNGTVKQSHLQDWERWRVEFKIEVWE